MSTLRYILGVYTLLLAAAYLFVGLALMLGAAKMSDEGGDWQALLALLAGMLAIVGAAAVMIGVPLLIAAVGLFARRRWAWWLAILLSFPVAACGFFFWSNPGEGSMILGVVQLCYPVAAVGTFVPAGRKRKPPGDMHRAAK